ncbi:MAG: DUF1003 domain-containing protein [Candidatus Levybacteria bacterium]|nr:DUF1003 domain-containing protein [Candidatus Levybacteria bacterium]
MKESKNGYLPLSDQSSYHRRLKSRRRVIKSFEEKANANRTQTDRLADTLTKRLGSMFFLGVNVLWFVVWITINIGLIPAIPAFDPFPFGLLTMIVSLEAICLAIIVLISQNRSAKIDDIRAETALQIDTIAEEEITKIIELQVLLLKKNGVDVSKDREIQEMLTPTDADRIETTLKKQFDKST